MPAKTKVTPEIAEYVIERRARGTPFPAIAAELRARGTPVSVGTIHKIAPRGKLRGQPATAKGLIATGSLPPPPADGDGIAQLDAYVAEINALKEEAKRERNIGLWNDLHRLLVQTLALRHRAAPPPPPPEVSRDDVAAAARAKSAAKSIVATMVNEFRKRGGSAA